MPSTQSPSSRCKHRSHHASTGRASDRLLTRWFVACSLTAGVLGLCWLLLRSAAKPSRLTYPCQQAALSAATLAFGAPFVAALLAVRRRIQFGARRSTGIALAAGGLVLTLGAWGYLAEAGRYRGPMVEPSADYRAEVFHVSQSPRDRDGDRFVGLDRALSLMGRAGLKFYRSPDRTLVSGPDGIVGVDDVVVIKINYQWTERGGTNVDLLHGLIHRIVEHPDGFEGEVVVCENAQFASTGNFDRSANNAQDHAHSPHDAVARFQSLGHPVSHFDWTTRRSISVLEYAEGDMSDGYVVSFYDPDLRGRVSYPKFRTDSGTYVSLRHGIWDPQSETYDRERLKFINVPVLKSHHSTYGVTACVKNYMGVVTGTLSTSSHSAIRYGLLGALLADIRLADLNILDCIWINANPYSGPGTSYGGATRRDELVVSVDPVAADMWAAERILIPAFRENGYEPPWPRPSADPDDPNSEFRVYLDNSMRYILDAGYDVTNDIEMIDDRSWNGAGDFDGDADLDLDDFVAMFDCLGGPDGMVDPACDVFDFNDDQRVDLKDFARFQASFTGSGIF